MLRNPMLSSTLQNYFSGVANEATTPVFFLRLQNTNYNYFGTDLIVPTGRSFKYSDIQNLTH